MAILRVEKSNPEYGQKNTTTLTLHSSHISGRQDVSIYHSNKVTPNTPIIFLLHGVYGSNWVWMELGGAHLVYEQLKAEGLNDFVLVMPSDGGLWDGSAYLPLKNHGDYEQWIVDDVLTAVIDNIYGVSEQSRLYISGLSMGGYGALRLGAKYPEKFSGISAHSSVTSMADLQQFIEIDVADYQCEFEHEADINYWLAKNKASLPPMRLDCGTEDSLYLSNLQLVETMKNLGVAYQFEELKGGHEWSYWHQNLAKTLLFFNEIENA
ncbi:alpha/beta hydrolase [Colwellia echini]|uniref:Prolyl oligopeptidase family serine peptidase n=1 Tax=Colwellia echini TaxID=1982103 RepID=A0ABY3N1X0_9GAMM|nr:alpha/beta hydrolase-fold protein [Colwellia echini]TYK67242.1 prolyl oligopeptidase family serine peptidase [Colwellia echini]